MLVPRFLNLMVALHVRTAEESERNSVMQFSSTQIERQLLESAAGQAVYDSLVQAHVNLNSVPVEVVKQMLVAECKYRKAIQYCDKHAVLAAC